MTLYQVKYYKDDNYYETDYVIAESKSEAILLSVSLTVEDKNSSFEDNNRIEAKGLCLTDELILQNDVNLTKTKV